jgi:hypothetical protein
MAARLPRHVALRLIAGGRPAELPAGHEAELPLIRALAEQAPAVAQAAAGPLPDNVVNWIQDLSLLKHIPFHYLVPDARMLPAESIRFFAVDPNWTAALIDGVMSIATASPPAAGVPAAPAYSGFLLRSAIVSDWPGLTVHAYSDNAGTDELQQVRFEDLTSIQLRLFAGLIQRVEFVEPHQHLHFGVESSDNVVSLRYIDAGRAGVPVQNQSNQNFPTTVPLTLRPGATTTRSVVDVASSRSALQTGLGPFYNGKAPPVRSAALSVQLAQATLSQTFQLTPPPAAPAAQPPDEAGA